MKIRVQRKITIEDEIKNRIIKRYPKLFAQKDFSVRESSMCFGIAVGIGWLYLIEFLCEAIDKHKVDLQFTQIKEKFGTLRIYSIGGDDYTNRLIGVVEILSESICEECGSVINVTTKGDYLLTLCKKCRDKRNNDK